MGSRHYNSISPQPFKGAHEVKSFLSKLQHDLNRCFPQTLNKSPVKYANKETKKDFEKIGNKFILYAGMCCIDKLDQLLTVNCNTVSDRKHLLNAEDHYGRSAVFYVIHKGTIILYIGYKDIIEFLLDKGVDLYKCDIYGRTLYFKCNIDFIMEPFQLIM